QEVQQRQAAIAGQMGQLTNSWGATSMQYYEVGDLTEDTTGAADGANAEGESGEAQMIRAGDVLFAVLDTHVNSDEPGPILATIVSGELKGAKLIGSLDLPQDGQKVILSFNTMTIEEASSAISINAVAVDPDTARTALSDSTNNHYLLRYGSLFASSFLEGMGRAFSTSGTRIDVQQPSGTIIAETNRSVPQNLAVASGEFGRQWGSAIGDNFNRPATVQVFSGTGLGILFTQDVAPVS
ncbi:MAG: TrbI/VirB10 family protein, partial [Gammaproteobacteria bacterium]